MEREEAVAEGAALRRFAANTAWMMVAQVAGKVASFVFVVLVARSLGAREFGYFNFALSFVPLFLVFGGFGLESTVIRELARDRRRLSELFASGIALRAGLGALGLALALATAPFFLDGAEPYLALLVVGVALFVDELSGFLGTVFKAYERMQFHALVVLVNRILSTGLAVAALVLDARLVVVCLTYLAGSLGAFVFGWLSLRRHFPPIDLRAARQSTARQLVVAGTPLAVASFLNTAALRIDVVMLQAIRGPVEVGLYGVAYRFFETLLFACWSLGNVLLPRLSRARDAAELARTFELTSVLSLAFYLPAAVTAPFAADWLVSTLFSDRYDEAAGIIGVLTAAALLYAVAYLGRVAAIALGRRREIAWIAAVTLAANVAMNAFAIPRYGFEGAAVTTLATEALEAILLTGLFVRATGAPSLSRVGLAPLLAAACLAAALLASGARDGAALAIAAVFYPVALALAARLLAPDETRALRHLFRRPELEPTGS
jgi:O-antigen/teichoic acid export membrane protein